jgi:hypothetical protein
MRTVACPVTDPASFALLAGQQAAVYPSIPGWSAGDVARRAVAEHGASLARLGDRGPRSPWRVLAAARAAMLETTLRAGRPELAIRGHDVLTWLAASTGAPTLASRSPEELAAAARGGRLDRGLIDLWNAVRTLDAFAG